MNIHYKLSTLLVYATREPPKMAQFDWFAIYHHANKNK